MPHALVDVLAVTVLVVVLTVAFVPPPGWVEVLVGPVAAGGALATGAVEVSDALDAVRLRFRSSLHRPGPGGRTAVRGSPTQPP